MNNEKISWKKLLFVLLALVFSIFVGNWSGDYLRLTEKPSEYIGLLYSILAAAVFAVVSIVGDPSMLLPGNRRIAWESAKAIQSQIQRLNVVFSIQIVTLLLLVVTEVIEGMAWVSFYWVFKLLGFFATLGFIFSFGLPYELARIQRQRLSQEIKVRTKK